MIKSYVDLEQSKKLAKILPLESADMYIYKNIFFGALSCFNGTTQIGEYIKLADKESKAYPCWSLAALLKIIGHYTLQTVSKDKKVFIVSEENYQICSDSYSEPVDACVAMIEKLHELKML